MNTVKNIKKLNDVHPDSKIWIYTISPSLTEEKKSILTSALDQFCSSWTAHSKELRAFWNIYDDKILVLGVDEHLNPASGCSIDKSVHFLQDVEQQLNISLFNRMLFSYILDEQIITLNRDEFQNAIEQHIIGPQTKVVNTLARNFAEWNENGFVALEDSWMKNMFNLTVA